MNHEKAQCLYIRANGQRCGIRTYFPVCGLHRKITEQAPEIAAEEQVRSERSERANPHAGAALRKGDV